jgi:hypothetical protein
MSEPIEPEQNSTVDIRALENKFFASLDNVQTLVKVAPDKFELNVRYLINAILINSAVAGSAALIPYINASNGNSDIVVPEIITGSGQPILPKELRSISIEPTGNITTAMSLTNFPTINRLLYRMLVDHFQLRFDSLLDINLTPAHSLYEPSRAQQNDTLLRELNISLGEYNSSGNIFEPYRNGTKTLSEISSDPFFMSVNQYQMKFGSEQEYLLAAIKQVAIEFAKTNQLSPIENEQLKVALREMNNEFREAAITPEKRLQIQQEKEELERQKKQKELQRQERQVQETREREELQLAIIPYSITPKLQSIKTRATRKEPPPEIKLGNAWQEATKVLTHLNGNLLPHIGAGNILFGDAVVSTFDHICTGAVLNPVITELTHPNATAREGIIKLLEKPLKDTAQQMKTPGVRDRLIEINREGHQKLIDSIMQSPLLLVAALGTPKMIKDAQEAQGILFPPGKRPKAPTNEEIDFARQWINNTAAEAVEESFKAVGRPIPQSMRTSLALLRKEPENPIPEHITERVNKFVKQCITSAPPYNMFRCNLGMQPGHTVTLNFSRWARNANEQQRVETVSDTIFLNEPNVEKALDMKKRIQSNVLNMQSIIEHRYLHEGRFIREDEILPASEPILDPHQPNPDKRPGRVMIRGGLYILRLTFPKTEPREPYPYVEIPLGVQQADDSTKADNRRKQVLNYLEGAYAEHRRVTMQDIRVQLEQNVIHDNGSWERPATINLRQYPYVDRDVFVPFPNGSEEGTTLKVGNPELKGSPNSFWTIPIAINSGGKRITEITFNTHVQDAYIAMGYIEKITSHIKEELETHGQKFPKSKWYLNEENRLTHIAAEEIVGNHNMDKTLLHHIKNKMGFVRNLAIHEKVNGYDGNAEDKNKFTIIVERADGSLFREKKEGELHPVAIEREFLIHQMPDDEINKQEKCDRFREHIHAVFAELLKDAYDPVLDREEPSDEPGRKAMQLYNAQTITNRFDAACRRVLSLPQYKGFFTQVEHKVQNNLTLGSPDMPDAQQNHHAALQPLIEGLASFRERYNRAGRNGIGLQI